MSICQHTMNSNAHTANHLVLECLLVIYAVINEMVSGSHTPSCNENSYSV